MSQPPTTIWHYAPRQTFWWYYDRPPDELLAPARRASTLTIVLGVLALLLGTCLAGIVPQLTDAQLAPLIDQAKRQQGNSEVAAQMTPSMLRAGYATLGVAAAIVGVVVIVVGALARGGRRGSLVVAMIAAMLMAGAMALLALSALLADPAAAMAAMIVLGGPIALAIWAVRSAIEALRAAPLIERTIAERRARRASTFG